MLRPDARTECLHAVCQGHINSLNLGDMRGLLDDAAGESGPHGAALPQSRSGSCDAHPVYYSGPGDREGLSGAALARAGAGHAYDALVRCRALSLGQTGQSHSGVDLPPALIDPPQLASLLLLLLPAHTIKGN